MSTENLKELRNALSCWQDDCDRDDDKEQYDMFGAAIDAVSRLEAAERERDELRKTLQATQGGAAEAIKHAMRLQEEISRLDKESQRLSDQLGSCDRERLDWLKRAEKAEAELARRDAAAGEVIYQFDCGEGWQDVEQADYERYINARGISTRKVYTSAPPAVLPPAVMKHLSDAANTVSEWTHGDEHSCKVSRTALIAAIEALGAQQQKVVELPELCLGVVQGGHAVMVPYRGGHWFNKTAVLEALEAANVKWEVRK